MKTAELSVLKKIIGKSGDWPRHTLRHQAQKSYSGNRTIRELNSHVSPVKGVSFPMNGHVSPVTGVSFPMNGHVSPVTGVSFPKGRSSERLQRFTPHKIQARGLERWFIHLPAVYLKTL